MTTVNPYLTFNGNCEEAFHFYKSVFGEDFRYVGRYKDMPADEEKPVTKEESERIMHISLPISKETVLMGCDTGAMLPPTRHPEEIIPRCGKTTQDEPGYAPALVNAPIILNESTGLTAGSSAPVKIQIGI
jgi:hypothetical protein